MKVLEISAGKGGEKLKFLCVVDGNTKWYYCCGKQNGDSEEKLLWVAV